MAVLTAEPASNVETRTCKVCGETKPLDEFVRTGAHSRLHTCKVCRREQRRAEYRQARDAGRGSTSTERQERAEMRRRLGHKHVEDAPDPAPARLLAELMRYDRDYGLTFERAWAENVTFTLDRINGQGKARLRQEWAAAFAGTRTAWEAAWRRQRRGPGSGLTPALLDRLSDERQPYTRPG